MCNLLEIFFRKIMKSNVCAFENFFESMIFNEDVGMKSFRNIFWKNLFDLS